MTTVQVDTGPDTTEPQTCWCCGCSCTEPDMVRLGNHPEVGLCLPCAHYLHQQARGREDARHRSPAARLRDVLRAARSLVIRRGWHESALAGRPLRWLGNRLP